MTWDKEEAWGDCHPTLGVKRNRGVAFVLATLLLLTIIVLSVIVVVVSNSIVQKTENVDSQIETTQ